MTAPQVDALPDPPQRTNPPEVFASKADAFVAALPQFGGQINTVATFVAAKATEAESRATEASGAANAAIAAAHFKGYWSSLTGALNVPASVEHQGNIYLLLQDLPDVAAQEPGASIYWAVLSATTSSVARFNPVVTGSNYTATVRDFVFVTTAGRTITLPANPMPGWEVAISVGEFSNTVVDRNGERIMGNLDNGVINRANVTVTFFYVDATRGWRVS